MAKAAPAQTKKAAVKKLSAAMAAPKKNELTRDERGRIVARKK